MRRGDPLSQRELEVVRLIAVGKTHVQIGFALGLSENTVHSHIAHCLKKKGVSNAVSLVVKLVKEGVV